jgi:hypothetical protein
MKNNKLIAEFMGYKHIPDSSDNFEHYIKEGTIVFPHKIKYYSDWNWLMEVVEKIEEDKKFDVNILQYGTIILDNQNEIVNNVAMVSFTKKIEHTYQAVVEFINLYNEEEGSFKCDQCNLKGRFDDGSLWGVGKNNMENILCTKCLNKTKIIKMEYRSIKNKE